MNNVTQKLIKDELLEDILNINDIKLSSKSIKVLEAVALGRYDYFLKVYREENGGEDIDEDKLCQLVNREMKSAINEIVVEISKVVPSTHLGQMEVDKNEYNQMSLKSQRQV